MSFSTGTSLVLAAACLALLYFCQSYRNELQEVRTQLTILQGDLALAEKRIAAADAASRARQLARQEADSVTQNRSSLLDEIPDTWGSIPLPDGAISVWRYDPATSAGPDSATGGTHGDDSATGVDASHE